MRIGIFDSGIGGLSVLYQARKMYPNADYIYYADEKNVPYGEKTEEQIIGFVKEALDFLIREGADAIVIACNTATSVADKEFRSTYPVPIVGMEPAVKKAVEDKGDKERRILVAATPVTIAGSKLQDLLSRVDPDEAVDLIPLPGLVRFAEAGIFDDPKVDEYLKDALSAHLETNYEGFVLGCTHFNYFKANIKRIFRGRIRFVDGNEGTVRQLMRVLPEKCCDTGSCGTVCYYMSGEPADAKMMKLIEEALARLSEMYEL